MKQLKIPKGCRKEGTLFSSVYSLHSSIVLAGRGMEKQVIHGIEDGKEGLSKQGRIKDESFCMVK